MSADGPSRSGGVPAADTGPDSVTPQAVGQSGRRRGWPWLIVAVGLAAGKAHAIAEVLHHRNEVIAVLGVGLAVSVLRIRLMSVAAATAALFALAVDPRSVALGIALGAGAFVLLVVVFFAIATVLHARQDRVSRSPPRTP